MTIYVFIFMQLMCNLHICFDHKSFEYIDSIKYYIHTYMNIRYGLEKSKHIPFDCNLDHFMSILRFVAYIFIIVIMWPASIHLESMEWIRGHAYDYHQSRWELICKHFHHSLFNSIVLIMNSTSMRDIQS